MNVKLTRHGLSASSIQIKVYKYHLAAQAALYSISPISFMEIDYWYTFCQEFLILIIYLQSFTYFLIKLFCQLSDHIQRGKEDHSVDLPHSWEADQHL